MPRNMPMCHGQLTSTDLRSFAPSAGVYGGAGGPAPNCAYATTERPVARPVASATRVKVAHFLEAMLVFPLYEGYEPITAGPLVPTAPAVELQKKTKAIAGGSLRAECST